ncbi:Hypothetical_protein [Hexamita inflata]|uniref:Hypothetical_protein n=1 Tax=Hexamita inflata TaxID=28002 RepID=A0AA86NX67_9EUKA|nr:Hypothetical protein HINF_LOCUS15927 [Hexamita inflata]
MKLPLSSTANQMALIFLSKFSVINKKALVDFRSVSSGTKYRQDECTIFKTNSAETYKLNNNGGLVTQLGTTVELFFFITSAGSLVDFQAGVSLTLRFWTLTSLARAQQNAYLVIAPLWMSDAPFLLSTCCFAPPTLGLGERMLAYELFILVEDGFGSSWRNQSTGRRLTGSLWKHPSAFPTKPDKALEHLRMRRW